MTPDKPHRPEKPPVTLAYRNAHADHRPSRSQIPAAIGMAILTGGIVASIGFVWVIWNLRLGSPRAPRPPVNWIFPVIWAISGLAIIVSLIIFNSRKGRKTVVAGIWIALGISLLLEGICFSGGL